LLVNQFDPFTIWQRSVTIWQEIFQPVGKKLCFLQNNKLTEIDRQIIISGRVLFAAGQKLLEIIRAGRKTSL